MRWLLKSKYSGSLIFPLLLILIGGCSKNQGGGFTPPPMPVEVAEVAKGTVADRFAAVGTLEAVNAITVVSQIDAVVLEIPFEEGSLLTKGDLIAQLDDAQLQAQKDRAQALRDQKKISYDRVKALVEQKLAATQELDDVSAALKIDELRLIFFAPERYLPELKPGAQVTVSTTAYPGYELKGRINVVEPVVDPSTRSVKITARVGNSNLRFRPGMSADVLAVLSERKNALIIPDEAIFAEGNQNLVYVIKPDSSVARTPVALGTRLAGTVEVLKGLEPGMKIVRAGHQKLFEGAKVFPVPNQNKATPTGNK